MFSVEKMFLRGTVRKELSLFGVTLVFPRRLLVYTFHRPGPCAVNSGEDRAIGPKLAGEEHTPQITQGGRGEVRILSQNRQVRK